MTEAEGEFSIATAMLHGATFHKWGHDDEAAGLAWSCWSDDTVDRLLSWRETSAASKALAADKYCTRHNLFL